MKLEHLNFEKAIQTAAANNFFEKLNKIYESIPKGKCIGCSSCCNESVYVFYTEFLNILHFLNQNESLKAEIFPKILNYYFLEWVEKKQCPFLNKQRKCSIYSVRPLTCRLFGHWEKKDFEENLMLVKKENQRTIEFIKNNYDLDLPREVLLYEIKYCEHYKGAKFSKHERYKLADDIFALDIYFLSNGMLPEDYINTTLAAWFVYTEYEKEKAGEYKIRLSREYLENKSLNSK